MNAGHHSYGILLIYIPFSFSKPVFAPPDYFPELFDLLIPPPLDFDDCRIAVDSTSANENNHHHSDDESSLDHSIFEFSDTDLSFDELSNDFAGRMHF